jgi:hypothetical protein
MTIKHNRRNIHACIQKLAHNHNKPVVRPALVTAIHHNEHPVALLAFSSFGSKYFFTIPAINPDKYRNLIPNQAHFDSLIMPTPTKGAVGSLKASLLIQPKSKQSAKWVTRFLSARVHTAQRLLVRFISKDRASQPGDILPPRR